MADNENDDDLVDYDEEEVRQYYKLKITTEAKPWGIQWLDVDMRSIGAFLPSASPSQYYNVMTSNPTNFHLTHQSIFMVVFNTFSQINYLISLILWIFRK